MPVALLCSGAPLEEQLRETALWREDVERRQAASADEALRSAFDQRPDVVVVDCELPEATRLVTALRRDARTRGVSIVVLAREDFSPAEVELMASGANAVLRLPCGPEWAERLPRLMSVPARKDVRLPVYFEIEARSGMGVESGLGTALNISASGLLIDSEFGFELGDVVDVRFQLPDSKSAVVGSGRVVRRAGPRRYGIEFFGLEGEGAEDVRRYVSESGGGGETP
jgi:CheY-like chemotaxis protein